MKKHTVQDPAFITKVTRWLERDGNSMAKLAAILGYKTSNAINAWLQRGNVPAHMKARVNEIITGRISET